MQQESGVKLAWCIGFNFDSVLLDLQSAVILSTID
jgi:hypothetical protein